MREKMIGAYIDQLSASFGGVRRPIEPGGLRTLYDRKDFVGVVHHIKAGLGLTMRLRIGFVNKGGPPKSLAWVHIPEEMPFYGTSDFESTSITMHIRKEFLTGRSFEVIVAGIAHELCHVVLYAVGHSLKNEEVATDLTAMMLGYRDFFRLGCVWTDLVDPIKDMSLKDLMNIHKWDNKLVERVYQAGYLLLDEINLACDIMRKLQK